MSRGNVREKILDTAGKLFYRDGIHATGIDTIIAQSEIARMTLYNHFPSKDALIEAVLRRQSEATRSDLERLQQMEIAPEEKLRLMFETLGQILDTPGFFGCPFINASAEYSEPTHLFHQIAIEYKQMYRNSIAQIVAELGISDSDALTAQIFLLVEGTLVTAQVDARQNVVPHALAATRILTDFYRQRSADPFP